MVSKQKVRATETKVLWANSFFDLEVASCGELPARACLGTTVAVAAFTNTYPKLLQPALKHGSLGSPAEAGKGLPFTDLPCSQTSLDQPNGS